MDRQLKWPPLKLPFEGERLVGLDACEWAFIDDGHGDGTLDFAEIDRALGTDSTRITSGGFAGLVKGKNANIQKLNEFYDKVESMCDTPRPQRADTFDPAKLLQDTPNSYAVLKLFAPATDKLIDVTDRVQVQAAGTRVMLAIEYFRGVNHRLPSSLDELATLPAAVSPLDPCTGRRFVYKVLPDRSATPSYVLYSVGFDGIDHGGRVDAEDAMRGVRRSEYAGWDAVFTVPRHDRSREPARTPEHSPP
jgi:hypothetical protein